MGPGDETEMGYKAGYLVLLAAPAGKGGRRCRWPFAHSFFENLDSSDAQRLN